MQLPLLGTLRYHARALDFLEITFKHKSSIQREIVYPDQNMDLVYKGNKSRFQIIELFNNNEL